MEGQPLVPRTSWTTMWPLSLWYTTTSSDTQRPVIPPQLSSETVMSHQTANDSPGRQLSGAQSIRAWVPSNTKLSVQAMWWGYRLYANFSLLIHLNNSIGRYLPPPVLDILSDKTLEATKRAAMITTALTWFFDNLPISRLPPPVMPAALLFQRLAPFLGYIGTFISWSWSTIKSYDIGLSLIYISSYCSL